jgi:hypothetical protein
LKYIIVTLFGLSLSGCSLFGGGKRAAEVVPSCFSDGENQGAVCKSQRTNEDNRVVVTRCIGAQNQEAKPELRGKCVEKVCSEGSNTDCKTRGEFAVLEQYAELATSKMFAADDGGQSKKNMAAKERGGKAGKKGKTLGSSLTTKDIAAVAPPVLPETPPVAAAAAEPAPAPEQHAVPPPTSSRKPASVDSPAPSASAEKQMSITLKPAKKPARTQASVKAAENGFKRVCVSKGEIAAPEVLRGKCAIRNCTAGKCTYKGRKEMFDWVASSDASM